jgi:hypothetical protein
MTLSIRSLGTSFALFVAVVASGCTDAGPTLSERSAQVESAGPSLNASQLNPLARFHTRPQVTMAWAKKWIGPEGGRLDFMGFAIDVPAGAVDRVTMFSLKLPMDRSGSEHVVAEFGPHTVTFKRPVAIEFPYSGTTIEGAPAPAVVWWNGGWVNMGGAVTRDGQRLRTTTDHFSTYGTTSVQGTTFVTSGG